MAPDRPVMIAVAVFAAAAYAVWAIVVIRTTNRRWERDLPLLTDEGQECIRRGYHQWTSEPGSALDKCACGTYQLRRCGCWQTTKPTRRPWFYRPTLYWYGWRTLRPFWLGDDEWCRRTLVLGWNITGHIIPLRECRGCPGCDQDQIDASWEDS